MVVGKILRLVEGLVTFHKGHHTDEHNYDNYFLFEIEAYYCLN